VSAPPGNFSERFKVELNHAPEGISLASVSAIPAGLELVFACEAGIGKSGFTGNLICDIMPKNSGPANPQAKSGNQSRRAALATLPAIPFAVEAE
jgi:hypothetical protein